jgi:chloride channel 7
VNIPGLFQLRTLFIKLISVICAVGGGLAVGQEGPMIHIGAMIAWNMSQMKFSSIPKVSYLFRKFQNDKDKRDFVTSGASMGVSAAFSAPM